MSRLCAWLCFTVAGAAALAALYAAGPGASPETVIGWLALAGTAIVLAGVARFDDWGTK